MSRAISLEKSPVPQVPMVVGSRKGKDPELVTLASMLLLGEGAARVLTNGRLPKGQASRMGLRYAHHPVPRKAVPKKKRGLPPDSGAAVQPQDEELGHIKILGVISGWRATGDQGEAPKASADANQESKVCVGLGPVERETVVAEATVVSDFDVEYPA